MQALRLIKETTEDGILEIEVPKKFGRRVEIILLPAPEESEYEQGGGLSREGLTVEEAFLAASYQAIVEDDKEEDAVWRKYIK